MRRRETKLCANPRCTKGANGGPKLIKRPPWRFRKVQAPTCCIDCRSAIMKGKRAVERTSIVRNGRLYMRQPGHLHADARGYVQVAILAAEDYLGRLLKLDERVTWLDRNPFNNDPSNLAVFSCEGVTVLKDRTAS